MDYVGLQRSSDSSDPRVEGRKVKSGFVNEIPDELVRAIVDGYAPDPARNTTLFFQHAGGAIGRVRSDATAFPHRKARGNLIVNVSWPATDDGQPQVAYLDAFWKTLAPFTDGYYTNEVSDETASVIEANYQGNLARLRKIKKAHDPANLFRLNANVRPA